MRLLNTQTLELSLFIDHVPEYAILSHRWEREELTFDDLTKRPIFNSDSLTSKKAGFEKVKGTCSLAARDGFEWVWIDSCCINKSSSSELQEAINSMFSWYAKAQICYVYLSDVPDEEAGWCESFRRSQWFTRGWTLQELIAPMAVEFYAADWSPIGSKVSRYEELAQITGIAQKALFHPWSEVRSSFVAAEKMSWAAHRIVTRAEDESYSLMGLFDINMPMLYGEGRENAFQRLQEAIYKLDTDHSLLLFKYTTSSKAAPFFAESASQFCQVKECTLCSKSPRCISDHLSYSRLELAESVPWNSNDLHRTREDYHFFRFSRFSSVIRLPVIRYKEAKTHMPFLGYGENFTDSHIIAVLNIRVKGSAAPYLGLTLEELPTLSHIRPIKSPVLLPKGLLEKLQPESLLVAISSLRPARTLDKNSQSLELRSNTFRIATWKVAESSQVHTNNQMIWSPHHEDRNKSTSITLHVTQVQDPDFEVRCTLKTSNINFTSGSGSKTSTLTLTDAEVSSGSTGSGARWQPPQGANAPALWDRISLKLENQGTVRIALRRLACPEQEGTANRIAARYRVDVEYAEPPLLCSRRITI